MSLWDDLESVFARDFNVDATPATLHFTVVPPVWRQPWFIGLVVVFVGTVGIQARRIATSRRERDRARERLVLEMQRELQTAHDMQMGLMPEKGPEVDGFDVVGRCRPTNHVCGDFFQ